MSQTIIVKNARGTSRGFGYIEFEQLKDFMKALDLKKGRLMGREFTIQKSTREISFKKIEEENKVIQEDLGDKPKSNADFRSLFIKK